MAEEREVPAVTLSHVPADQRHRVLSGMRWTVWLSAVAVPFSACMNFLFARVGPETIGVFGLLSVYIGFIAAFLYFGGDTVIIKFVPECDDRDRGCFLQSYLLLILLILLPLLLLAYLFPAGIRTVLGRNAGDEGNFLLLCLAPLPIIFFMVVAALKGMLEIRFSQLLGKSVTIISLLAYVVVFLTNRPLLAKHSLVVIWGAYFGVTALLVLVGAFRVLQLCGRPRLRFYLPKGLARYALDSQLASMVHFLSGRIDYILILNFGGLAILGQYVAVMAVAGTVLLVSALFMDTLLPSVTNMIAGRNERGAAQMVMVHMRILFLVTVAVSCAMMVAAAPATVLMGAKYRSIRGPIILMAVLQGIATPGAFGGTLLVSVGEQRLVALNRMLYTAFAAGLFLWMWPRWHLYGAVISFGLAAIVANTALMATATRASTIFPPINCLSFEAALVETAVGIVAFYWLPLGPLASVLVWIVAVAVFLWLGRYSFAQLKQLAALFIPGAAYMGRAIGRKVLQKPEQQAANAN